MPNVIVNGCELYYELLGASRQRCLLFIGGLGMDCSFWMRRYTSLLESHDYGMLVYNPRGIAPSATGPLEYTIDGFAADARALIDSLGLREVTAIGASLGALVAQELALTAGTADIRGLFLMATQARQSAFMRAAMAAEDEVYRNGSDAAYDYLMIGDLLQGFTWRELTDDRTVQTLLRIASATNYRDPVRHAHFRAARAYDNRLDRLASIEATTYVVGFQQDIVTPASLGRAVADRIPRARYFEIDECGHFGFYSHAKTIVQHIEALLGELAWSPRGGQS